MAVEEKQIEANLDFLVWRMLHGRVAEYVEIWRGSGERDWVAPPPTPKEEKPTDPTPDDSPELYA